MIKDPFVPLMAMLEVVSSARRSGGWLRVKRTTLDEVESMVRAEFPHASWINEEAYGPGIFGPEMEPYRDADRMQEMLQRSRCDNVPEGEPGHVLGMTPTGFSTAPFLIKVDGVSIRGCITLPECIFRASPSDTTTVLAAVAHSIRAERLRISGRSSFLIP